MLFIKSFLFCQDLLATANTIRCYKQFLCRKDKGFNGVGKLKILNKFKQLTTLFYSILSYFH